MPMRMHPRRLTASVAHGQFPEWLSNATPTPQRVIAPTAPPAAVAANAKGSCRPNSWDLEGNSCTHLS